MKITFQNDVKEISFKLVAETLQDCTVLFKMQKEWEKTPKQKTDAVNPKEPKKKRKHYTKGISCEICGTKCRGLRGIGIHNRKKHGIIGANAIYQRELAERKIASQGDLSLG